MHGGSGVVATARAASSAAESGARSLAF
eukprot:COSAG01_NODE_70867_length_257_cov_1.000000_1_plen_27_part_10